MKNLIRAASAALLILASQSSSAAILAAGDFNACAELDGVLACWGFNLASALVDSSDSSIDRPIVRPGVPLDAKLEMSGSHFCAVTSDARLICWGRNVNGQVGLGFATAAPQPPTDLGLTGIVDVALGSDHTCALKQDGEVICWGRNSIGQMGNANVGDQLPPLAIALPDDAIDISAGGEATCAVLASKKISCWGTNTEGQLGLGITSVSEPPSEVAGLVDAESITVGGYHACARRTGGKVSCWGNNSGGQVNGTPSAAPMPTPKNVAQVTGAVFVEAGGDFNCYLDAAGLVRCWGSNSRGQFGGGVRDSTKFQPVTNLAEVAQLAVGTSTACARETTGAVKCWGANAAGELGRAASGTQQTTAASVLTDATDLDAGESHSCAVEGGKVYCWGKNDRGQLGLGYTGGDRSVPTAVSGVDDAVSVALGVAHTCALDAGGEVHCWGSDTYGQTGSGVEGGDIVAPVLVPGVENAISIDAGDSHACAVRIDGTLKCWGLNLSGQIGNGAASAEPAAPTAVNGLANVVSVATSASGTCAIDAAGGVSCWGSNFYGGLGQGMTGGTSPTPVAVANMPPLSRLVAGAGHFCGLTTGAFASLYCWGQNANGQVGNGSAASDAPQPAAVKTGFITSSTAGANATCVTEGNATYCWGESNQGKLGPSDNAIESPTPVSVYASAKKIAIGTAHSCAILANGTVACTGEFRHGEHGDGMLGYSAVPLEVSPILLIDSFEGPKLMQ